jgi:hypothetical protein
VNQASLEAALDLPDLLDFYLHEHRVFWHEADAPAPNTIRPAWRASGLGKCMRSQVLQRAGVPKTRGISTSTERTFQMGDDLHWFARRRFERMGVLLGEEISVADTELHLTGHIDALVGGKVQEIPEKMRTFRDPDWVMFLDHLRDRLSNTFGDELPVIGVEIKSMNSWSARKLRKEGVRYDHAMQAAAYRVLGDRHPDALPATPSEWRVLVLPKDSMEFQMFGIGDRWVDEAMSRLETLNAAWDSGEWPNCSCGQTPGLEWERKYCDWIEGDGCCGQSLLDLLEASI